MDKLFVLFLLLTSITGCSRESNEPGYMESHISSLNNDLAIASLLFVNGGGEDYTQFQKGRRSALNCIQDCYSEIYFLAAVQAIKSGEYYHAYCSIKQCINANGRKASYVSLALLCFEQAGYEDSVRQYIDANSTSLTSKQSSVLMQVVDGVPIESCDIRDFSKSQREYLEFLAGFKKIIDENKLEVFEEKEGAVK
jgi:hypothetical protein